MIFWTLAAPTWDDSNFPSDFLSDEEINRLKGMRFQKRRNEWLRGRWTAKHLMQQADPSCAGMPLASIIIRNEPEGLPFAWIAETGRSPGWLSISHSDQFAFCVLSKTRVGADIEQIEARSDSLVEDYFTLNEARWVRSYAGSRLRLAINLVWSAKESVLKALGKGLRLDTREVEIGPVSLAEGTNPEGAWHNLTANSPAAGGDITAWWQVHGSHVMTIAALGEFNLLQLASI
jgi:4'-phosphopantetheinyl transferase